MTIKLSDLPALPSMPILQETPEDIYRRWVNRAIALAQERGLPPPPTDEGEYFYDLWYPLAIEFAEQQALWTYGFLQGFPIWADGEFLEGHGWAAGLTRKEEEDDDTLRLRMLERASTEEGSGRCKDYETWAKEMEGVGSAIAREKERHDNSIDLYLTDLAGQPITDEFAETVKSWMWEERRIAGHDLEVHPAPVYVVVVAAHLITDEGSDLEEMAARIQERVMIYASERSKLAYNYVGSLLLVTGVEDYENYTLNGMEEDVEMTPSSIPRIGGGFDVIPERYRGMLPAYWYEVDMANRHFSVLEQEMNGRERTIDDLGDQFILSRASWALWIWEWIYFRKTMGGSDASRREAIRRKLWGSNPFRLSILRDMGNQYGKLVDIIEDFKNKEIDFQFSTEETIDQESLKRNFEYIRPVHIRSMAVSLKAPDWSSGIEISEHYSVLNYPFQAFASNTLYAGVLYDGPQVAIMPTPPVYSGGERIAQTYERFLQAAFPITGAHYAGGLAAPVTVIPANQALTYSGGENIAVKYQTKQQAAFKLTGTINAGTGELL